MVKRGDMYVWYPEGSADLAVHIEVLRVAKDQDWADIECSDGHEKWTKRQKLLIPGRLVEL